MSDPLLFTADQILAVPVTEPERLFDQDAISDRFKALVKLWHPDLCSDAQAEDVTFHVTQLRDAAEKKIAAGLWVTKDTIELHGIDGKVRKLSFKKRHQFELGTMYYGPRNLTYVVDDVHADLFHSAEKEIERLSYRSPVMAAEMAKYLPEISRAFATKGNSSAMIIRKTDDVFLLRDVLTAVGGALSPEHVAWILNSAYNIACYLEWAELTHNAISVDTYFISPSKHSGLLLGGWWYATRDGTRMNALPSFALRLAPTDVVRNKKADSRLDLMLIRAMGRELLGDITGMSLLGAVPDPMVRFLRSAPSASAHQDYVVWQTQVLPACFGKRRFVELKVNETAVYG